VTARLASAHQAQQTHSTDAHKTRKMPPAVIWLKPIQSVPISILELPATLHCCRRNKMFTPHLLVVPVGSSVCFPNADPFFHNVFSLSMAAVSTWPYTKQAHAQRSVFLREGVRISSCNIHSEMSAVVISADHALLRDADQEGAFHLNDVPDGEYELHVWIEGQRQSSLNLLTQRVHIAGRDRGSRRDTFRSPGTGATTEASLNLLRSLVHSRR